MCLWGFCDSRQTARMYDVTCATGLLAGARDFFERFGRSCCDVMMDIFVTLCTITTLMFSMEEPPKSVDSAIEFSPSVKLLGKMREPPACTKSPFRMGKHLYSGHMQFMQDGTLKNHIKNCKDSSFESQQVSPPIPLAVSMDPRTNDWFLVDSWVPVCCINLFYVYLVTSLIPRLMRNRQPFHLKYTIIVFNLFQICYNIYIFFGGMKHGWAANFNFLCQPIDHNAMDEDAIGATIFLTVKGGNLFVWLSCSTTWHASSLHLCASTAGKHGVTASQRLPDFHLHTAVQRRHCRTYLRHSAEQMARMVWHYYICKLIDLVDTARWTRDSGERDQRPRVRQETGICDPGSGEQDL
ncbi:hypothetical protein PR048_005921 [Dryococelus australis]|uniref:Elongation of very long chain fatty acids protein n=1 Tax=Dryococelus australis TaxID=614101 RepID=A0ABQ9I9I5_9NEOP|nr:hypothetical protein PR048_005921 [Dryococelus australis]